MARFLIETSHAREHPDRLVDSLTIGRIALEGGHQVVVLMLDPAAALLQKGAAQQLSVDGQPVSELMGEFLADGGQLWVLEATLKRRQWASSDLMEGGQVVGEREVIGFLAEGASTLFF